MDEQSWLRWWRLTNMIKTDIQDRRGWFQVWIESDMCDADDWDLEYWSEARWWSRLIWMIETVMDDQDWHDWFKSRVTRMFKIDENDRDLRRGWSRPTTWMIETDNMDDQDWQGLVWQGLVWMIKTDIDDHDWYGWTRLTKWMIALFHRNNYPIIWITRHDSRTRR